MTFWQWRLRKPKPIQSPVRKCDPFLFRFDASRKTIVGSPDETRMIWGVSFFFGENQSRIVTRRD
jgi:hypothetical protein